MIQRRQRSRHGDNHRETSNHNRSLERRAQGKATFTDQVMDCLLSRQTDSERTYFYTKLTERTPDIQACSLLLLASRADSALCVSPCRVEGFHAFTLIIHIPLLSFLTGPLTVCLSGLELGWMLNSLQQPSPRAAFLTPRALFVGEILSI